MTWSNSWKRRKRSTDDGSRGIAARKGEKDETCTHTFWAFCDVMRQRDITFVGLAPRRKGNIGEQLGAGCGKTKTRSVMDEMFLLEKQDLTGRERTRTI